MEANEIPPQTGSSQSLGIRKKVYSCHHAWWKKKLSKILLISIHTQLLQKFRTLLLHTLFHITFSRTWNSNYIEINGVQIRGNKFYKRSVDLKSNTLMFLNSSHIQLDSLQG